MNPEVEVLVVCPRPRTAPRCRLFLLPHAGGSCATYFRLATILPEWIEAWLVEYPGHGRLIAQPFAPSLAALAAALATQVASRHAPPPVLFGHSMGGLVAYLTACELERRRGGVPAWLGISATIPLGEGPPRVFRSDDSDASLLAAMRALGGVSDEVLAEPELLELTLGLLRADLALIEGVTREARDGILGTPAQIATPLTAFAGNTDAGATPALTARWATRAAQFRGPVVLEGGHFYFQPDPTPLAAHIAGELGHVLRPTSA